MNIKNSPFCFEDLFCEYPEGFPSAVEVLSCTLVSPTLSTNNPLLVSKEAWNVPCDIEDSRRAIRCSDVVPSVTRTVYVTLTPDSNNRLFCVIKSSSTEASCTSSAWAIVFFKALRKEGVVVCAWVTPWILWRVKERRGERGEERVRCKNKLWENCDYI